VASLIIILTILLKIAAGVTRVVRVVVYDPRNNKSRPPLAKTWPPSLLLASTLNAPKSIITITKRYLHGLLTLRFRGLPLSIMSNYCVIKLATWANIIMAVTITRAAFQTRSLLQSIVLHSIVTYSIVPRSIVPGVIPFAYSLSYRDPALKTTKLIKQP
jgi:hypothetical protein